MDIRDLVRALLAYESLTARAWVAAATRGGLRWSEVPPPSGLSETELAVAAGVIEMLAERAGQAAPGWTSDVQESPTAIFLVRAASQMRRLRTMCETEGPEPLRRRRLFAPPDFLRAA